MRVLLVPNPANPRSVAAAFEVAGRLAAAGFEPVLATDDAVACGVPDAGVPRAEIGEPLLAVALGGDGTILKAVHLLGGSTVPVLGVNLGRLGFLSGAGEADMHDAIASALAGEGRVESRQTIEAAVSAGGRAAGEYRALNEVFVGRSGARGVELEVTVNGTVVWRHICDGLVVATPSGSTAYALSAGGPLVAPEVRGMVLVSVAPHDLGARPLVLGPTDRVSVRCPNPSRADACVSVDGDQVPCRTMLDSVEIGVGEHDVRLVRLDGDDFYATLARTFLGA